MPICLTQMTKTRFSITSRPPVYNNLPTNLLIKLCQPTIMELGCDGTGKEKWWCVCKKEMLSSQHLQALLLLFGLGLFIYGSGGNYGILLLFFIADLVLECQIF